MGCKKDYMDTKIYLLSQQITDDRADNYPIDTTTYTYDEHDRIIGIVDGSGSHKISFGIEYDNQNRVTTARKFDSNGALFIEFDFFYKPDTSGYYFYGPTHAADTAYFNFNDRHQVIKIMTKHSGYQTFTYDGRGNVATTQAFAQDGSSGLFDQISFAYDTQKNPFSESSSNNLFFMYIAHRDPSTLINNVLVKDADTYTYTYNKDGFPTSATINTGKHIIPVYFNYIIKTP